MNLRKLYVIYILFSVYPFSYLSADWNNFVINYSKNLYGKGSQTWQIAPYNDCWVYFANKNGMLQFDGTSWSIFPLHNGSDLRSVLPSTSQKRIYAAGINEFGDQRKNLRVSPIKHIIWLLCIRRKPYP